MPIWVVDWYFLVPGQLYHLLEKYYLKSPERVWVSVICAGLVTAPNAAQAALQRQWVGSGVGVPRAAWAGCGRGAGGVAARRRAGPPRTRASLARSAHWCRWLATAPRRAARATPRPLTTHNTLASLFSWVGAWLFNMSFFRTTYTYRSPRWQWSPPCRRTN